MRLLPVIITLLAFVPMAFANDFNSDQIDEIVNFISDLDKNVTWPKGRSTEGGGQLFVVAALGKTPITAKLIGLNTKKSSADRKIKVRLVSVDLLPSNAHVIFISSQDEIEVQKVLKLLKGTSTLTITHGKDFGKFGSMINFYTAEEDGKSVLKYELNMTVVEEEKLEFKKDLTEIAEISK
jgi:hypothetical protein